MWPVPLLIDYTNPLVTLYSNQEEKKLCSVELEDAIKYSRTCKQAMRVREDLHNGYTTVDKVGRWGLYDSICPSAIHSKLSQLANRFIYIILSFNLLLD